MTLQVAEHWFEHRAIDDDLTLIWEPHVTSFGRCNIWHVRGRDRDILIDTGMGMASLKDAIGHMLDKPVLAVASHTHFDHVGSHHEFDDRVVHAGEADILAHPTGDNTVAAGYVDETMITALPHAGYDIATHEIKAAPATRVVEDGDVIDLGERVFEVIHMPGHSPGSMGLWEAASGLLFSGAAIYDGELLGSRYHSDVPDYLETLERLRGIPARVVHGGHKASFGHERMIELVDDYMAGKRAPGCPGEATNNI
jgi:glyoxylase-like metal-dependent hydrolase (beta-lactamase superfamily II)